MARPQERAKIIAAADARHNAFMAQRRAFLASPQQVRKMIQEVASAGIPWKWALAALGIQVFVQTKYGPQRVE